MKSKSEMIIKLPKLNLPPEVAHTISCWLYGLAHEFDLSYSEEIRSHMQWMDNQRDLQEEYGVDGLGDEDDS